MSRLCIIPARGGSKRIPRKNIRPFLGKPIIAYSIEAALASGLFDEVMVSTDDEEIAAVARQFGASVPFMRSAATADDFATTVDVIAEVLGEYRWEFAEVCCVYATAPFVTVDLLKQATELRLSATADCVFPALAYSFPVQRSIELDPTGKIRLRHPEHLTTRSQDLLPVYHDAGMFYTFDPAVILAKGSLWTDNTRIITVEELAAHDIDTPADWRVAEFKHQLLHEKS
ncbi:pseudaminic acid cytidylyltransferase [Neolewinella antarctica]|uniref:N-acylneuraminate cytidylyltransferase n=1 Tax=Neolewinella antarctica TaxID=442734 RepID=A0ABX0XA76_9BACT|nr:pseudaminic acid cytidylyltransferase [Neolewinella antarctica]NJC26153.1 N-acylneuraminate cytidylyltransferase [Neolewinella antarctica]